MESFNNLDICSVPFYNTYLDSFSISSRYSGGITISSAFLEFSSGPIFGFVILSVILLAMNSPIASVALLANFKIQSLKHLVLFL